MSGLLGSITGALGRLFGNFWGDPTPPELPKPSEPPVPEEEPEVESDGESDYETALAYQNTDTRWYSAIRRFLFWKKQGYVYTSSSMMVLYNGLAPKMTSVIYPETGF